MTQPLKMSHVTEGAPLPKGDEAILELGDTLAAAVQREREARRLLWNAKIEHEGKQAEWALAKLSLRRARRALLKALRRPFWTRWFEMWNLS